MKTKLTTIIAILSMGCAVWLLGENRGLKQIQTGLLNDKASLIDKNNQLKHERDTLADQYVSLLEDYSICFDEALRLEDENQLLGSLVSSIDIK
tara:strand:- start:413 stop:694 length:282 start_codon:yes stop_codon:yes gene_type:complete